MKNYDAIFIGSGINSLTGAAMLAKQGKKVCVLERNNWFGGNIKTDEITVPGFKHDVFSGFHPLFVTGPAYAEFKQDLEKQGLKYVNTDVPTGILFPDNRSAVLYTDRQKNIEQFEKMSPGDGQGYDAAMKAFAANQDKAFGLLGTELWSWDGMKLGVKSVTDLGVNGFMDFLGGMLTPARSWLQKTFKSEVIHGLFAPWVLHTGLGPDEAASGYMNQLIIATLEMAGMPVPQGGGQQLPLALERFIREHDGEFFNNADVEKILVEKGKAQGVVANGKRYEAHEILANVTPTQLYGRLLNKNEVPQEVLQEKDNYVYGRADMQIHLALDKPPQWPDERLNKAAIVHMTNGLNGLSRAVNEAERGLLPAEATIVCGQHTAVDPTRAPKGKCILWFQLQELPQQPIGDAAGELDTSEGWTEKLKEAYADRIIDRMAAQLPGFRESIVGRNVMSPAELSKININLVGGDPYSGKCSIDQFLFWRPLPGLRGHKTPVKHLHHIGASTHPGPGLNGTSGFMVASKL